MGWDPVQTATRRKLRKVAHGPRVRRIRRHPRVVARGRLPGTGSRLGDAARTRSIRDSDGLYRASSGGWRSATHHEYDPVPMQGGDMPLLDCHWPRPRWRWQGRVE